MKQILCNEEFGNHIAVPSGAVAYYNNLATAAGCAIHNASGTITTAGSWERDNMGFGTATNIADKTSELNNSGKYLGRRVFDTSNNRIMVALGSTPTSNWKVADGSASVTPA